MMFAVWPWWARVGFVGLFALTFYAFGVTHGERVEGQRHIDYVNAQAQAAIKLVQRQQEVVVKTEVKMRDRVQVIYKQGEEIEKQVPIYITSIDDQRFAVSNGWVRLYDAAFAGEPPGPATELDHEPARISTAAIAEANAFNATACRQWREQALGWREFYSQLQSERP